MTQGLTCFGNPRAVAMSQSVPEAYLEVVKDTHETGGGFGSVGYGCRWKREEAFKNILRTHTTAISSQARTDRTGEEDRPEESCLLVLLSLLLGFVTVCDYPFFGRLESSGSSSSLDGRGCRCPRRLVS